MAATAENLGPELELSEGLQPETQLVPGFYHPETVGLLGVENTNHSSSQAEISIYIV